MQSFETYLNDEIFVDYFNTFLSLPIFPRRFLYRSRRKKFEFDPPLRTYQVDKKILFSWISSERLTLFWTTDLFLDYLLCKLLISQAEQAGPRQVSTMVDDKTLRKHIGHLIGMQQFRHYTKGTMGQCILNFWCDAEKFRRHTRPELRRFVFREIQYQYLKNGSAYELPSTIKCCIYGDGYGQENNVSIFSEDIFVSAQSLVVADLYSYWVPKYILHKCREIATTYQQRRLSRAIMAKHFSRDISPKLDYNQNGQDSETEKRTDSNPLFEAIDEDEEFENEKNVFFETNRVSSSESDDMGRRSSPFLPDIKSTCTMLSGLGPKPKAESSRKDSFKLPELCPSFNNSMASESSETFEHFPNRRLNRRNTRQFSMKELLKPTMPYAMLENEDSRKTPKTAKKNRKAADLVIDGNVLLAVDKASATNIVQIIKPAYHEEIPKKPLSAYQCMSVMGNSELCAPIKPSSDERTLLVASVMSDRLAGGPLRNYLKRNGNATALANLQFWEDVQIYIAVSYSSAVDLKFRHGRNLLVTYLQPESVREVQLEPGLREKVCRLVRRGQADMLLKNVSDQILEFLYEPWKNFVEDDRENLLTVLEQSSKRKVLLDDFEPGDSLDSSHQGVSFRVHRALDLALCLVQGEFQAIDVEEEEEVTSESDDEDEGDAGSLRKRRLTIVNEEAAVALAFGTGERLDPNARRKSHFYGKISRKSRKSSLFSSAALKTRPPKPRKFLDILTDNVQLLWLKRFLTEHEAIIPLKFWQDVEKMKTQSKDSRARQTKARVIVKSYFANIDDPSRNLMCNADIIKEIPRLDHVTPAMLVSAQACVIRSLEEQWFGRYLSTFPEDAREEDTLKYAARNTLLGVSKLASSGKTRGLWALFGHSMMTFIRGVTKPQSCSEFMKFLVNESKTPAEGRKNVHNGPRRIVNNRVIFVDRLINDLMFWLEVQRFKLICDGASTCAMAGNYTIDDEILVRSKAKTILDCYIESLLPPKVQVNITQDMADAICHLWSAGIIDRGMFHDAEINIFCVLINYWKRFLAREPTSGTDLRKGNEKKSKKKSQKKIEKQVLYLDDIPYRKLALGADEEPRMSFSLVTGLRIIS